MAALASCLLVPRELGHVGMQAAAIYMCTLGAATTYVQVQLALASRSKGATASFVPVYIAFRPLGAPPPTTARRAELVRGLFGLMGRHAGVLLALTVVLLLAAASDGIRPAPAAGANELVHGSTTTTEMVVAAPSAAHQVQGRRSRGGKDDLVLREEVVRATGSSLPDCSHACGACSPCSRVMVSFKCSASEPVPCPMVYRCMCRGKCYPVPSS